MIKNTDTVAHWMAIAASERMLRFEAKEREQIAIESFDEERQRALREAGRVSPCGRVNLSEQVSAILGERVTVNTEDGGVGVFSLESCQLLLCTGNAPKNLTADWIARTIERKAATAASVKIRREKAANDMRAHLAAKGINSDGLSIYYTSTGFSVCNFFRDGMAEAKRILEESGVAFKRLEYSEAHWVVRVIL